MRHCQHCSLNLAVTLPASLSGQLIYPGRQMICITGDGGFAMLMADFTTAVFNKLPVKVIVFNDGKLKNIKKEQEVLSPLLKYVSMIYQLTL